MTSVTRGRLLLTVAATLAAIFHSGSHAQAGQLHPAVVSATAASNTPHLKADSTVDHPLALSVAQIGDTIFVGGKFTSVENAKRDTAYARSNLFAFDVSTGAVSETFKPFVNQQVFALLADGNSLYVGGQFGSVDGIARRGLVKLDATTGAVDKKFNAKLGSGRVSEIRMVNGRLIIGGTFPKRLQAVDPVTGADTGYINIGIDGTLPLTTSRTEVYRFAVNPAGDKLIGVGNFTTVSGQNRKRAFMLDLGTTSATLSPWYYAPLDKKCASNTPTRQPSLDDVDFSPDGSYFVFAATGFVPATSAEIGTAVCDCAARFETNITTPVTPTWINYTGGDTVHSVTITGAAVYVQGHFRWLDNPFGRDSAGPGAVERKGIGAIDPVSGKALPWNPSAPAAQGGQELWPTATGLWAMSDNLRYGGKYHRGISFAPLPPANP
jgi:hypothetical protein